MSSSEKILASISVPYTSPIVHEAITNAMSNRSLLQDLHLVFLRKVDSLEENSRARSVFFLIADFNTPFSI